MTPKEEADLLGFRFRDAIFYAFTMGVRAGQSQQKNFASVLCFEEYEKSVQLWEEVLAFMRRQVEEAKETKGPQKPKPKE